MHSVTQSLRGQGIPFGVHMEAAMQAVGGKRRDLRHDLACMVHRMASAKALYV